MIVRYGLQVACELVEGLQQDEVHAAPAVQEAESAEQIVEEED
jgi:hypothetical protein